MPKLWNPRVRPELGVQIGALRFPKPLEINTIWPSRAKVSTNGQLPGLKPSDDWHPQSRPRPRFPNRVIPNHDNSQVLTPSGPPGAVCPNRADWFQRNEDPRVGPGRSNGVNTWTISKHETFGNLAPSVPATAEGFKAGHPEPRQRLKSWHPRARPVPGVQIGPLRSPKPPEMSTLGPGPAGP